MADSLHDSLGWPIVRSRALARDGHRCTVSRLLGGRCSPTLHVHHLVPVSEGGELLDLDNVITACARHHPQLEALRRHVLAAREPDPVPTCPHNHRTPEARAICERTLRRRRERGKQLALL